MVNYDLARERNLSKETIAAIEVLHRVRKLIEDTANINEDVAKAINPLWVANEFALQKLWGFEQNGRYHKFWNYPFCTCPKIDNKDRYPSRYYYHDASCPIHKVKNENNE